jgi:HD-like signal output (HDOD) protein/CheY-like chemotaxis protein
MKRRILFVDDEPQILEGLRHRLHRQCKQWDMLFASSGIVALEVLTREPIDVIVTDMRMPHMDGATLLKKVQESYPSVVRIVLSGHAELETALRAVPVAHQFLSKPCDPGVIENVVERACRLQSLVTEEVVKQVVGKIEKLPSLPRVYAQLVSALSNESTSTNDVAKILKQDMAICAKTLQVVNSAFFRLPRPIGKIEEAVQYLGLTTVKHITLAVEVFNLGSGRSQHPDGFSIDALQRHSLLVGEVAAGLFLDKHEKEDAFVVGLLHDIGRLLIGVELSEQQAAIVREMQATNCTMTAAEEKVLRVTHAEIGGYLLGLWGLPYTIIEAVANHHDPSRVDSGKFDMLAAVHVANALVHEVSSGQAKSETVAALDTTYLDKLGVMDKIDGWREDVQRQVQKRGEARS